MIDRFEPTDWYENGRPRAYRDNETGEEISLGEYRKRRKIAASVDEGEPDESDIQLETQAFADPAPRPRLFDVSAARDEPARTPGVRKMGLTEMLAPAFAGFATTVANIRMRNSPRRVFIPPTEVTTPIIAPIGRICDRHLPAELSMLMGEDGRDVTQFLTALGAGMVWFKDAVAEYERYQNYVAEQYAPPADRRATGNVATPPDDIGGNWAADIFQRVRGSGGAGAGEPNGNHAANGDANAPGLREISGTEAANRIHDLLRADAEGIMRRGLVDGQ